MTSRGGWAFMIGAPLGLMAVGGVVAIVMGADPRIIGLMAAVSGGTVLLVFGFAAGLTRLLTRESRRALTTLADHWGARLEQNWMGEARVIHTLSTGRVIVDLASLPPPGALKAGQFEAWTRLRWELPKGHLPPTTWRGQAAELNAADVAPPTRALLAALFAAAPPGVKVHLEGGEDPGLLVVMTPGWFTDPAELDAMARRLGPLLPLG